MSDQTMIQPSGDNNMQDAESHRSERKHISSLNMNRKQRRNFAKKYGLMKDHTGEAWRIGNKHMKGEKQNQETVHKLGDQTS